MIHYPMLAPVMRLALVVAQQPGKKRYCSRYHNRLQRYLPLPVQLNREALYQSDPG